MSDGNIVRRSRATAPKGKTDWERVNNLSDKDIETQIADDPDVAPALTPEWLERALLVTPVEKELVSIRLDLDVLEHFRAQGRGYQTRINGILRTVMEHEKKPA